MALATSLRRISKSGLAEFFRNGFVTAATVYSMSITLFIVGTLIFLRAALMDTLTTIQQKVDINIYLQTSAQEDKILALKKTLEAVPEVAQVSYISRDEALKNFKERHKDDQLILQAIDEVGSNPLGATLSVRAKDTSQYESIAKFVCGTTFSTYNLWT
jgi:cell division transport system permease protein